MSEEKPEAPINGAAIDDPFSDLNRLRIPSNFAELGGVKTLLVHVLVRRPDPQWFVRVHPSETYRLHSYLLQVEEERGEYYFLDPAVVPAAEGARPHLLCTAINRQGKLFLWPVRLPAEGRRRDAWALTALEAATRAQIEWVKVAANQAVGAYEISVPTATLPEPEWPPEHDFAALLRVAFQGRYIATPDHLVLRRLRGEV